MQLGGLVMVLGLGGFMLVMFRKDAQEAKELKNHDAETKETHNG
jgi:hypothetical protein